MAIQPRDSVAVARQRPDPSRIQDLFLARLAQLEERVAEELARPAEASSPLQEFLLDASREAWTAVRAVGSVVSEPRGFLRRLALAVSARPSDELGVDAEAADSVRELLRPLMRMWLGFAHAEGAPLAADGGVLVLVNRGAWPLPAEPLAVWTVLSEHAAGRPIHALWDERYLELPLLGDWLSRIGFASPSEDNCRALLERGRIVIGFPEGRAALSKTYDRRYRLARFSDTGMIAAAIDAGAAIVPAALIGNEESFPVLGNAAGFPVTAQFPALGAAGLLPLPLAWRLKLGTAVEYPHDGDPAALADAVQARVQAMLAEMLAARTSIVRG